MWGNTSGARNTKVARLPMSRSLLMLTSLWQHVWGHVWSRLHDVGASITIVVWWLMLTSLWELVWEEEGEEEEDEEEERRMALSN